jgi:hypothetical protein
MFNCCWSAVLLAFYVNEGLEVLKVFELYFDSLAVVLLMKFNSLSQ